MRRHFTYLMLFYLLILVSNVVMAQRVGAPSLPGQVQKSNQPAGGGTDGLKADDLLIGTMQDDSGNQQQVAFSNFNTLANTVANLSQTQR